MRDDTVHGARPGNPDGHPVLDLEVWRSDQEWFEPDDIPKVERPDELASVHRVIGRELAQNPGLHATPCDAFVWSYRMLFDRPWLTRLGGKPWMETETVWPTLPNGEPKHFLGQISFVDSKDLFDYDLPGDVLLFFGEWDAGWVYSEHVEMRWSQRELRNPWNWKRGEKDALLPFEYQGVRLRTSQIKEWEEDEDGFVWACNFQATMIGSYGSLPQGWPFEDGDGNSLVAVLSTYLFANDWPLCDVPQMIRYLFPDGSVHMPSCLNGQSLRIGDMGCLAVYRNAAGEFVLDYLT